MNTPKSKLTHPCLTQFQQFVELKDYRPRTKREYVRYVRKLAEHFQCDPSTLSQDRLREHFIFLRQQQRYAGSSMQLVRAALRSFFVECLKAGADWTVFDEVQVRRPEPLPFVLSREEVAALLGAVREPRFRACLRLVYHCGLRVGEAVRIEVRDIQSAGGRIHSFLFPSPGRGGWYRRGIRAPLLQTVEAHLDVRSDV